MRIEISKEWCMRMAELEADAEIGAGALSVDPVLEDEPSREPVSEEAGVAFGRFVKLMRRSRGLTVERLAQEADVDLIELVGIEEDAHHRPELRTVYQLASVFGVQRANLLEVAGLIASKDSHIMTEAVRFAARSGIRCCPYSRRA